MRGRNARCTSAARHGLKVMGGFRKRNRAGLREHGRAAARVVRQIQGLGPDEVGELVGAVISAFDGGDNAAEVREADRRPARSRRWPYHGPPATKEEIEGSVDDLAIRCFETGRRVRDLEPILARIGMSMAQYRRRWGLPATYPTACGSVLRVRAMRGPLHGPPATPEMIEASVTPEGIRSFEDGRVRRVLTNHLRPLGLTPEEYRRKWGLPRDYPMVSADYRDWLSELGRDLGEESAERRRRRRSRDG